MSMISQDKIDEVKQAADIIDVISEHVSLQPSGKGMKGLCPFHSEKTPSFHVNKELQIFNCFGCHKKGNVFSFIEEFKHMTFPESVRYLAEKYNVELDEDDQQIERQNYNKLYDVNNLAKEFFNLNLLNLSNGKKALEYLESRKIDKHTLNSFNIGFAPGQNNQLLTNLSKTFQEYELVEAGLINRSDSGDYYDVFRDRIVFPILNEQGKVLGFSGRALTDDKNTAKYMNTQATKIFNKSEILYNLDKALPHIARKNRLVLMEGFFDVIKASMAGIEESVCTMGTELTQEQARKIKRHTDNVVVCYDGDKAGKQATYRALSILEKVNLNVQIALMPDGMDPDDYIEKHSPAMFRNQLNQNLIDKFDFVYEMIINKGLETSSDIENAKISLFNFLLSSASKTITMIYLQKFADNIKLPFEVIQQDYNKYLVNRRRFQTIEKKDTIIVSTDITKARKIAEEKIINYYLQSDAYRDIIENEFFNFSFAKGMRLEIFFALKEIYLSNREVALYNLKTDLSEDSFKVLEDILLKDSYHYSESELKELIDTLILESLIKDSLELRDKIGLAVTNNNREDYDRYQTELGLKRKTYDKIRGKRNDKKANI